MFIARRFVILASSLLMATLVGFATPSSYALSWDTTVLAGPPSMAVPMSLDEAWLAYSYKASATETTNRVVARNVEDGRMLEFSADRGRNCLSPTVHGKYLAYVECTNTWQDFDVVLVDLESLEKTVLQSPSVPSNLFLDSTHLVWSTYAGEIYECELAGGSPQLLGNGYQLSLNDGRLAYVTNPGGSTSDVVLEDLQASSVATLDVGTTGYNSPCVSGNLVAWTRHLPGGYAQIIVRDLTRNVDLPVSDGLHQDGGTNIAGRKVAWNRYENGYRQLMIFDVDSGTTERLSREGADAEYPRSDGTSLVWGEYRGTGGTGTGYQIFSYNPKSGVSQASAGLPYSDFDYPLISPYGIAFKANKSLPSSWEITLFFARPLAPNHAPEFTPVADIAVQEGAPAAVTGTVRDPDGDSIQLTASSGCVSLAGDGTWTWSRAAADADDSGLVTLTADDGHGISTTSFKLTVLNVAPTLGALSGSVDPVRLGSQTQVSGLFWDPGANDVFFASVDWGDGVVSPGAVVRTPGGGTLSASHFYSAPGVYTVGATVTDKNGETGSALYQYVVVFDSSAGFVTGGGSIASPLGAYGPDPSLSGGATFGFVSRYAKGASVPNGNTEFQFHAARMSFKSTSYDWLVVTGCKAQYRGQGTINGLGGYAFVLTAMDGKADTGGGVDRLRMRIWNNATGALVYDNQRDAALTDEPTTALASGSIVVHK